MRILIIGGTRFMGPVVVQRLVEQGHEVAIFHRGETNTELPGSMTEIHGDRENLKDHAETLRALTPDAVIDMIALTQQQAADLVSVFAEHTGRIVMLSSCDVYRNYGLLRRTEEGRPSAPPLRENSDLRRELYPYRNIVKDSTDTMYHYDKILVEQEISEQDRVPWVILRLPMVYGPGDRQHRLYSYVKRMADDRPAILIDRAQTGWRSVRGYRDNCAAAVVLAALNEKAQGVYNTGEEICFTEREWISLVARRMGWGGRVVPAPNGALPTYLRDPYDWSNHLEVDSSRIREELGYREPVVLDDWLRTTIRWELENPPDSALDEFDYAAEDEVLSAAL